MPEVGPLLASGRDGDIFEYGPGRVLRRARDGRVIEAEARVMQYLAAQGYPVPRIDDVLAAGTEIVMERIEGRAMVDEIAARPYALYRYGDLLADLHDRLHRIAPPPWLAGDGPAVCHHDLHPINVLMGPGGPVVIDWTGAAAGQPLTDVGFTYVLLACGRPVVPAALRPLLRPLQLSLARRFASRYRGPEFDARTAAAAAAKATDPHLDPVEVRRCLRLAERLGGGAR